MKSQDILYNISEFLWIQGKNKICVEQQISKLRKSRRSFATNIEDLLQKNEARGPGAGMVFNVVIPYNIQGEKKRKN